MGFVVNKQVNFPGGINIDNFYVRIESYQLQCGNSFSQRRQKVSVEYFLQSRSSGQPLGSDQQLNGLG